MQIKDVQRRKNLSLFLKEERKVRGWSQRDLARYLEATQNAVYMWEAEKATPDTANFDKLAELFGLTTWELLQRLEPNAKDRISDKLDFKQTLRAMGTMSRSEVMELVNTGVQILGKAS
jgi:transcriptional regulator with XRE-family HTH domain